MERGSRPPGRPRRAVQRPSAPGKKIKIDEGQRRKSKFWILRIGFVAFLVFLGYTVLAIKTESGDEYELNALRQLIDRSTGDRAILPNRGSIMDRNNQALALSSTVYDIVLDVRTILSFENAQAQTRYLALSQEEKDTVIANRQKTLDIIHRVLAAENGIEGVDMPTLQSYLAINPETGRPVRDTFYLIIAQNVKRSVATDLQNALNAENLRHVYAEEDTERRYIYDNLAASLIGFSRGDSVWGLERQYGTALTGVPGRVFNAFGDSGSVESERVPAVEGHTLITTLDLTMQQYAERICEKYAKMYDAPYSSILVMDPYTAELYTMAQYPTFNLNTPVDVSFINKEDYALGWAELPTDEMLLNMNSVWANFNLTSTFEPGSIYKPMTVAGALEDGVISTGQIFTCNGFRTVSDYDIPCHRTSGHGAQTLEQALANSCNVAMMDIAAAMGRESFYNYLTAFGYGDRTGIDLPAEAFGILHPYSQFHSVELATASFGQRFNCTAIQALTSFCATINGGNVMRPYTVSQVVDEKGQIVTENKPLVQRKVISQETSDFLRRAMESTISPTGTGRRAVIDGWAIGGKTATGEQGIKGTENYSYSLSFITYFPIENPQYAVLALLHGVSEEMYDDGAASAADMVKEMMLEIIKYKAIPPTYAASDTTQHSNDTLIVDDYIGRPIDEVTRRLNQAGLDYEMIGGSCAVVTGQFPAGGSRISNSTTIFLTAGTQEGAELVMLPSVTGLERPQAEALLTAAGLVPFVVENAADANELPQTVVRQMPEPDIYILKGTAIRLKVE